VRRRIHRALPAVLFAGALVGTAGGLVLVAAVGSDADPPATVVETQPSLPVRADPELPTVERRPAYLIVQDEIDRALAERDQRP
jgi:hypothetical protein